MMDYFERGMEDEGERVYKVLPMAFKGEPRLIFMQTGLLGIPDESAHKKRASCKKKHQEILGVTE